MPFTSSSLGDEDAFSDLSCDVDDLLPPRDGASRATINKSASEEPNKPQTMSGGWPASPCKSSLSRRRKVQLVIDTSGIPGELQPSTGERTQEISVSDGVLVPQPLRWQKDGKKTLFEPVDDSYKESSGPEGVLLRRLTPVSQLSWRSMRSSSPVSAISTTGSLHELEFPEIAVVGEARNRAFITRPSPSRGLFDPECADEMLEEEAQDFERTEHDVKGKLKLQHILQETDTKNHIGCSFAQGAQEAGEVSSDTAAGVASENDQPLWLQDEVCLPVGFFGLPNTTTVRQTHFELAYGRLIGTLSDAYPSSEKSVPAYLKAINHGKHHTEWVKSKEWVREQKKITRKKIGADVEGIHDVASAQLGEKVSGEKVSGEKTRPQFTAAERLRRERNRGDDESIRAPVNLNFGGTVGIKQQEHLIMMMGEMASGSSNPFAAAEDV